MKKLFLFAALFVAAVFSSCSKHNDVETPVVPEPQPLAIAFAEGNSLEFGVNETRIVHYTITGGSNKTVVKAELQPSDDAYTVETASTSATEGMIAITAKKPETENCIVVTVSDSSQTVTAEIAVSTNSIPEELAIAFTEGNSLEFDAGETKIVHYTITGGNANNVVKAEMQNPDGAYALSTTQTSATEGTIKITAQTPTENRVIVTVSDGSQTITAEIAVSTSSKITITVETPGTLSQLLAGYDKTKITELIVIGNLNKSDITTLKNLPNLAVLDMEHVNLEVLPAFAFGSKTSLTSVKLPLALKTIENYAFSNCTGLTSVTIGNSVTSIGGWAFESCRSLTSVTIPNSITSLGYAVFIRCSNLTAFYGKFASLDNRCLIVNGSLVAFAPAGLTSYTISDSVTSIGHYTFQYCSGLTSITIGNNVKSIEQAAFWDFNSLTRIYCKAKTPPSLGYDIFYNVSATLYVPTGSKAAYAAAKGWKNFTTIIETQF